jgi:hypothetical protein
MDSAALVACLWALLGCHKIVAVEEKALFILVYRTSSDNPFKNTFVMARLCLVKGFDLGILDIKVICSNSISFLRQAGSMRTPLTVFSKFDFNFL